VASDSDADDVVQKSTYVEFESHVGCVIVAPEFFELDDRGSLFVLSDGQAQVVVQVYSVEGSGLPEEFRKLMLETLKERDGPWREGEEAVVEIGGAYASKDVLEPVDEDDEAAETIWHYTLPGERYYYSLMIRSSPMIVRLNGGFYEGLVRSFRTIESRQD
jgi:hypothetical protein